MRSSSDDASASSRTENSVFTLLNSHGFNKSFVEKMFGQAVDSKAAASLYFWFGRFRAVLGFRVEIFVGELLVSEIVDDGDEEGDDARIDADDGDFMISRSILYVLRATPPKYGFIFAQEK